MTEQGRCALALPYDKLLIAGQLGLTPESLSRAFAKLRTIGVMVDTSHVEVKDVAKLRQLANDDRGAVRDTLRFMQKPARPLLMPATSLRRRPAA